MGKMMQAVLAASLVLMAGCVALPNNAGTTSSSSEQSAALSSATLDLGFAGTSYSTLSILSAEVASASSLTFQKILFKPTKIEVHFVSALSELETSVKPTDIAGTEADQSTAETAGTEATRGEWLEFPIENGAEIDLTQLGSQAVSFGNEPLKVGKYDLIRLTGAGSYEAVDSNNEVKSGAYYLPSDRLYISQGFEVREGYKTDLKFAFDAKSAMVVTPEKIILKPNSVKVHAKYTELPVATASPEATASVAE